MTIQTQQAQHLSEATKDLLRTLLRKEPLVKGDGDYEIGREVLKTQIKQSLEAYTGVQL
jgi:hypothetical protein